MATQETITVYAKVTTSVDPTDYPTGVDAAIADIYLHDIDTQQDKTDLGADTYFISTDKEYVFITEELLTALLDTVEQTTDLPSVYRKDGSCIAWTDMQSHIEGFHLNTKHYPKVRRITSEAELNQALFEYKSDLALYLKGKLTEDQLNTRRQKFFQLVQDMV